MKKIRFSIIICSWKKTYFTNILYQGIDNNTNNRLKILKLRNYNKLIGLHYLFLLITLSSNLRKEIVFLLYFFY